MKHLNITKEQTKLFDSNGAFFAFSSEQWEKANDSNLNYKSLGSGLYCPEHNAGKLTQQLKELQASKIQWELDNNTLKDIIWYELANYETQITGDITDAYEALIQYGISKEDVIKGYAAYYQHCVDNDYF